MDVQNIIDHSYPACCIRQRFFFRQRILVMLTIMRIIFATEYTETLNYLLISLCVSVYSVAIIEMT